MSPWRALGRSALVMRTLAITQNMSADGSIEFLGDWFDPTAHAPDLNDEVMRQSEAEDVLLLGRQTFEDFRSFWPQQTDDQTGITAHLNRVHKVVVSSTLGDPEWENSTVLGADWRDRVRALKEEDGGDIVVHRQPHAGARRSSRRGWSTSTGSSPSPRSRGGAAGSSRTATRPALELRDSRAFSNGVVLTVYARA